MEQRAIMNRYVYHVANRKVRESILKKGLIQSAVDHFNIPNAVYANNGIIPEYCWYPWVIYWEFFLEDFDFWRIDTLKLGAAWFVDCVMYKDSCAKSESTLYVYTKNHIPAE